MSKKQNSKTDRLSIRLTPGQQRVLSELKDSLGTTYSVLLRAIVLWFITSFEDQIEELITSRKDGNYEGKESDREDVSSVQ